ncbi:solute carrier family 25 protein [archaeon]|nr:MAG: solute carrier family 25 protein [archaeon]
MDTPAVLALLPAAASRNFIAGFTAGGVATLITQPADLIRTRLQLNVRLHRTPYQRTVHTLATAHRCTSSRCCASAVCSRVQFAPGVGVWGTGQLLVNSIRHIAKTEGVTALFVGSTARILKRSLSTAVTWTLFEEAMRRLNSVVTRDGS